MKTQQNIKKSERTSSMNEPYSSKNSKSAHKIPDHSYRSDRFEDDIEEDNQSEEYEDELSLHEDEEEYVYSGEGSGSTSFLGGKSLADIILQKLKEKELGHSEVTHSSEVEESLSPKIIEVYSSIGDLLSKYRSGKLPKAIKVLPHLKRWEDILALTNPADWSPAGTFAITKVFSSNLNAKLVQRYFHLVLLEKCRADIEEHHKLNFHLYHALKRALFKPAAFYKGIVLPLLQSGTCTQQEAVIFSSVLSKASIPAIHSAAVLLKLLELQFSIPTLIFIKQILQKKYAFPVRVITAVAHYFCEFSSSTLVFPVIWHQTVLLFVQRYKKEIAERDREGLLRLIQVHHHPEISQEIKREFSSLN